MSRPRGTWRRRGGSIELRVGVGRDPLTGRQTVRTRTIPDCRARDADDALARFVLEVGAGPAQAGTFGELARRWLDLRGADWSPATRDEHARILDRHCQPLFDVRLDRLRTDHLDALYGALRQRGGVCNRRQKCAGPCEHGGGGPLSPATVRRVHVVVRSCLEQAVRWGLIARNPAAHASPGRVEADTERDDIDPDHVRALLTGAATRDPELAVFLLVAATTGARRGELCALRWTDVDLDAGLLAVRRSLVAHRGGIAEKQPKTARSRRRNHLDPLTVAALAAHRARALDRAQLAGGGLADDAFVFSADPDGRVPWRPDSTSRRYRQLRDTLGLPATLRLHDLRHWVVTQLVRSGVDLPTVADRVGHAPGSRVTLGVYARGSRDGDQAAAGILGALLSGTSSATG